MNSRIREIVIDHVGEYAALIAELEAYHDKAMIEAADGALMAQRMLEAARNSEAIERFLAELRESRKIDERREREQANRMAGADERDASLDVRPGAQSPGEAVRDYVAGMVDDLRLRRDVLTQGCDPTKSTMRAVGDIIERNAPAWQGGESDDERARR